MFYTEQQLTVHRINKAEIEYLLDLGNSSKSPSLGEWAKVSVDKLIAKATQIL